MRPSPSPSDVLPQIPSIIRSSNRSRASSIRFLPVLLATGATLLAGAAEAQHRPAPLQTLPPPALELVSLADTVPASQVSRGGRVMIRSAAGAVGVALGFLGGVHLGAGMDPSGGEDPGLLGAIIGGAAGGVLGGGVAAALPGYGGGCPFGARLSRGVLGSLAGTFAGAVFLAGLRGDDGDWLLVPLAGGVGAGVAAEC